LDAPSTACTEWFKCFRISVKKRHAHAHISIYREILISKSSELNCKEDDPVGTEAPKMLFEELKRMLET
jgi:hypothetical protein